MSGFHLHVHRVVEYQLVYTVPEEPALHVYLVTEDPSVILKRAMSNKQYVDAELRRGRNVLLDSRHRLSCEETSTRRTLRS